MPNYQYQCLSCSKQFLQSLPFGSKKPIPCPLCKKETKRLITPPMVHFKGSGFYKTDSQTKEPAKKENVPIPTAPPVTAPSPSPASGSTAQ